MCPKFCHFCFECLTDIFMDSPGFMNGLGPVWFFLHDCIAFQSAMDVWRVYEAPLCCLIFWFNFWLVCWSDDGWNQDHDLRLGKLPAFLLVWHWAQHYQQCCWAFFSHPTLLSIRLVSFSSKVSRTPLLTGIVVGDLDSSPRQDCHRLPVKQWKIYIDILVFVPSSWYRTSKTPVIF